MNSLTIKQHYVNIAIISVILTGKEMNMSKINLEKIMNSQFLDLDEGKPNNLKAYQDSLKILAESNMLTFEQVTDLVTPSVGLPAEVSDRIEVVAHLALDNEKGGLLDPVSKEGIFLPGYSAVVVTESGDIVGVQSKPNQIPKLESYGPGLMWALMKAGHERFARVYGVESTSKEGYELVGRVLNDGSKPSDLPLAQRQHIGGAGRIGANFMQPTLYAGVSGVVLRDPGLMRQLPEEDIATILDEAYADREGILDDFDQNLFAGSLDSSLATEILDGIYHPEIVQAANNGSDHQRFAYRALRDVIKRRNDGINVH